MSMLSSVSFVMDCKLDSYYFTDSIKSSVVNKINLFNIMDAIAIVASLQ